MSEGTLSINGKNISMSFADLPTTNGVSQFTPTTTGTLTVTSGEYAGTYSGTEVAQVGNTYWVWPGGNFSMKGTSGWSLPTGGRSLSQPLSIGVGVAALVLVTVVIIMIARTKTGKKWLADKKRKARISNSADSDEVW